MIREKELDTGVGFPNTVEFWFKHKGNEKALVGNPRVIAKPYCFSACAYAFLGGVQRWITDDAQYGVHQFRSYGEAIGEAETQTVTGVLGAYLGDLGIHRDLLQLALWTGPQDVFILSREQLEELNVVTSRSIEKGEWDLEALKDGTITARISSSDLRYTNRRNTVLLKKQGSQYQVYLITKIPKNIMGQEGYANQCKEILSEGRKAPTLTMSVGDDNYWYEYEFELGSDGLLVISFALSHEVVSLMEAGRPINIIFYPPNICRPFQIVSPPLPTTNQENTVKAIIRQ